VDDEFWVPLVDEPIGDFVARVQAEDEEVAALVASPRRQLAFRTFAYIRVGLALGELLFDMEPKATASSDDPAAWVSELLADERVAERLANEVRAVAREVAADPRLAGEEGETHEAARRRVRRFVRGSLGG
jgi:hypothetical protein